MKNIKYLAKKWFDTLGFPQGYDDMFDKLLICTHIPDDLLDKTPVKIIKLNDYTLNLVYALAKCEELEKRFLEKGISRQIFADTISDILIWSVDYYQRTGTLGLQHIEWISHHLKFEIFTLGRLQYTFSPAKMDYPAGNIRKGDNTLGIHIPRNGSFTPREWESSFKMAKDFFPVYFPEYKYTYYTCFSWLLSPDLHKLVKEDSNTLKFQKLFDIAYIEESDIMLYFTFGWGTTVKDLANLEAKTSLQKRIKEYVSQGNKLTHGYGFIQA